MRNLSFRMVFVVALALVAGCTVPPFELRPETPNLSIEQSKIRPLKIAIVVQDPMPYNIFYNGAGCKDMPTKGRPKGGCYRRDVTADSRSSGLMLERDLSNIASETLSQAFREVVVLRDLPEPGQYDAVVNLDIGQILLQEHVILTGETCDITAEWSMSVLDNQNKEFLSKKGISPSHNFKWSVVRPSRTITIGMNSTLSLILSELATEWGATLYNMEIPATARGNP